MKLEVNNLITEKVKRQIKAVCTNSDMAGNWPFGSTEK
jgi:hypothetical protein